MKNRKVSTTSNVMKIFLRYNYFSYRLNTNLKIELLSKYIN